MVKPIVPLDVLVGSTVEVGFQNGLQDSLGSTGAYNREPARVLTTAGAPEGLSVDINVLDDWHVLA